MHPEEKLLGLAMHLLEEGKKIPLDMLVRAEELGLHLDQLGEPSSDNNQEGDED